MEQAGNAQPRKPNIMIPEHIEQIEAKVEAAKNISDETRKELLGLLSALKSEIGPLAKTHDEDAESIARFADASAHEATRTEKKPELIDAAVKGLSSSVEGFETSHPTLVQIVNRIAVVLSNMGI